MRKNISSARKLAALSYFQSHNTSSLSDKRVRSGMVPQLVIPITVGFDVFLFSSI